MINFQATPRLDASRETIAVESRDLSSTWTAPAAKAASSPGAGLRLGPYWLVEPIGSGSQGVVWRASQREPVARELAIKLLSLPSGTDRRRLARFRREAARGMRLGGPGILPVYDFGEFGDVAYMVMPLVDGISLQEVIARRRNADGESDADPHWLTTRTDAEYLPAVVRVLARVAHALARAHNALVVHRDVKPGNILLDRRREEGVFLADFGLSRDLNVATPDQLRDGAGTPIYMAPEKLQGRPSDEVRSDVYALGVTLFEATTLSRPFRFPAGCPTAAQAALILTSKPRSARALRPGFPPELEAIIHRAMAPDPADRHPNAAALASDLDRFLARSRRGARMCLRPLPAGDSPPLRRTLSA
jgi:serine/threonine protein kinase